MKIHYRILLYIISTAVVIFSTALGYVTFKAKSIAFDNATKLADSYAQEYANLSQYYLNEDIDMVRTLSITVKSLKSLPLEHRQPAIKKILEETLNKNSVYNSAWCVWKPKMIDTLADKAQKLVEETAVEIITLNKNKNKVESSIRHEESESALFENPSYIVPANTRQEIIRNPYTPNKIKDSIVISTVAVPIIDKNTFLGVVGINFRPNKFQDMIETIKPFGESHAFLVSNNGYIVAHPKLHMVSNNVIELNPDDNLKHSIAGKLHKGEKFSFITVNESNNQTVYVTFAPVFVGKTETPWSIGVVVPFDTIMHDANRSFVISLVIGLVGLIVLMLIVWLVSHSIALPITQITHSLEKLAKGNITEVTKLNEGSKDETSTIAKAVNTIREGLIRTVEFTTEVGRGNLETDLVLLSKDDVLGNSLLEMRKSLRKAKEEEEKRKIENEKHNWTTKGIAQFSDILRLSNDIKQLSYNIISNLVDYTGVTQGGFFVINDSDPKNKYAELIALQAYGKYKHQPKKIESNIGLIGRSIKEKETIYVSNIPQNYAEITTGIKNTDTPRNLLIVPLTYNEEVYGVVEMLSIEDIPQYKIDFVVKVGENIASTISSMKISSRTNQLLHESKLKSEELALHEEQMRESIKKMKDIQSKIINEEKKNKAFLDLFDAITYTLEFDFEGNVISASDRFCERLNISKSLMLGLHHRDLVMLESHTRRENAVLWDDMKAGNNKQIIQHLKGEGLHTYMHCLYIPFVSQNQKDDKVLMYAFDLHKN